MRNPVVKIREEMGMSRRELALKARLSYSTVSGVEACRYLKPSNGIVRVFSELGFGVYAAPLLAVKANLTTE